MPVQRLSRRGPASRERPEPESNAHDEPDRTCRHKCQSFSTPNAQRSTRLRQVYGAMALAITAVEY